MNLDLEGSFRSGRIINAQIPELLVSSATASSGRPYIFVRT
jgi:hypothetical protein